MSTIGPQLQSIYAPRLRRISEEAVAPFALEVTERMKENTEAGRGFGNDPYDDRYSRKYSKWRTRKGYNPNPVILRAGSKRIERTTGAEVTGDATEVGFVEGGRIFKYHHDGTARGGKIRSIFPKEWASVPAEMYARLTANIAEVMRGLS